MTKYGLLPVIHYDAPIVTPPHHNCPSIVVDSLIINNHQHPIVNAHFGRDQ